MYKKVSDPPGTFQHIGIMGLGVTNDSVTSEEVIELPMTYIMCPICKSRGLRQCPCMPTNYQCMKCNWKHTNHHHPFSNDKTREGASYPSHLGNINMNAIIAKNIRK